MLVEKQRKLGSSRLCVSFGGESLDHFFVFLIFLPSAPVGNVIAMGGEACDLQR